MTEILWVVLFALGGAMLGCITGLIPGLHVNNLALIMLALAPAFYFILGDTVDTDATAGMLICVLVLATAIAHTFVNLIPGTFLGAPDENALAVLPAHAMLLDGNGYQAVHLSAIGSLGAIAFGFAAVVPFRYLICEPINLYDILNVYLIYILISISVLLLYTERGKIRYKRTIVVEDVIPRKRVGKQQLNLLRLGDSCVVHGMFIKQKGDYYLEENGQKIPVKRTDALKGLEGVTTTIVGDVKLCKARFSKTLSVCAASFVFTIAGLFGLIALRMHVSSPLGLPSSALFPVFVGLFGVSTLAYSMRCKPEIPAQKIIKPELDKKSSIISIITGALAGSLLGFLPGVTAGHATTLSILGRRKLENAQTLLTLSAVNTSYAFFCLIALFIILKTRNGTTLAIARLIDISSWEGMIPLALVYLLIAVLIASIVSYFMTIYLGKLFAKAFVNINYKRTVVAVVFFIVLCVFLFTGLLGLMIFAVAVCIGLLAPVLGVRRTHAMGVLLVPTIMGLGG